MDSDIVAHRKGVSNYTQTNLPAPAGSGLIAKQILKISHSHENEGRPGLDGGTGPNSRGVVPGSTKKVRVMQTNIECVALSASERCRNMLKPHGCDMSLRKTGFNHTYRRSNGFIVARHASSGLDIALVAQR